MHRVRTVCLIALASAAGLVVAVGAAWAVDSALAAGRVPRNTEVAGHSAGGLRKAALTRLVASVADDYRSSPVVVQAPGGGFSTNAHDLGLSIDTGATERAAMHAGRRGSVPLRLFGWAKS